MLGRMDVVIAEFVNGPGALGKKKIRIHMDVLLWPSSAVIPRLARGREKGHDPR